MSLLDSPEVSWNNCVEEFNNVIDNIVMPMSNILYTQFIRKKSAWELLMKTNRKNGSIDMTKIQNYKTSDDIFKRKVMLPKGKSHGIVVLVDNSGSMSDDIYDIMHNVTAIALFAKRANVKFEAYMFTSHGYSMNNDSNPVTPGDGIDCNDLKLINLFNSTMSTVDIKSVLFEFYIFKELMGKRDFLKMLENYTGSYSEATKLSANLKKMWSSASTPLAPAYMGALERAALMKESGIQHVSMFTLTDGDGDGPLKSNDKIKIVSTFLNPFNQRLYLTEDYHSYMYNGTPYNVSTRCNNSMFMMNTMANDLNIDTNHIYIASSIGSSLYAAHSNDLVTPFLKNNFACINNVMGFNSVMVVNMQSSKSNMSWHEKSRTVNTKFNAEFNDEYKKKMAKSLLAHSIVDSICRYY